MSVQFTVESVTNTFSSSFLSSYTESCILLACFHWCGKRDSVSSSSPLHTPHFRITLYFVINSTELSSYSWHIEHMVIHLMSACQVLHETIQLNRMHLSRVPRWGAFVFLPSPLFSQFCATRCQHSRSEDAGPLSLSPSASHAIRYTFADESSTRSGRTGNSLQHVLLVLIDTWSHADCRLMKQPAHVDLMLYILLSERVPLVLESTFFTDSRCVSHDFLQ